MRPLRFSALAGPALAVFLAGGALPADAQPMHVSPPYADPVPRSAAMLSVEIRPDTKWDTLRGTTVGVNDGRLIVTVPGRSPYLISLAGRTTVDVVNELNTTFEGLYASTGFALRSADYIGETDSVATLRDRAPSELNSRGSDPQVAVGFGALLNLGGPGDPDRSGLLSQTGFVLDVGGVHQLSTYSPNGRGISSYITARINLASDQDLIVGDSTGTVPGALGQFDLALRQADQLSLAGQLDLVAPLFAPNQEVGLYVGADIGYAELGAPRFPLTVPDSGGVRVPFQDVFSAEALARATGQASRTTPLTTFGAGGTLRFIRDGRIAFYFGLGYQRSELPVQKLRFQRDGAGGRIDPESLTGGVDRRWGDFVRVVGGVRIPGVVDVRADALTSLGPTGAEPLLRIALARTFPIAAD